jgi:hypothetical protein
MSTMLDRPTGTSDRATTSERQGDEPESGEAVVNSFSKVTRPAVVAALVVSVARFAFAADRRVFSLGPDEMATVGMARFIAGGHWSMLAANTYRPALSSLLAPIFVFVDDQDTLVRMGLTINALVAGISVLWFVRLIRRLTPLSSRAAAFTAAAIALTPSSLVASAHLWAEPLVSLSFMAALLAVLEFYDRPTLRGGIRAVSWSVLGYTAHGRLLPLIAIVAAALLWRACH